MSNDYIVHLFNYFIINCILMHNIILHSYFARLFNEFFLNGTQLYNLKNSN